MFVVFRVLLAVTHIFFPAVFVTKSVSAVISQITP